MIEDFKAHLAPRQVEAGGGLRAQDLRNGYDDIAMRGDRTDRRELLAGWLLVVLILALVAIALRDVM